MIETYFRGKGGPSQAFIQSRRTCVSGLVNSIVVTLNIINFAQALERCGISSEGLARNDPRYFTVTRW